MSNTTTVGKRLKTFLKSNRISQTAVAEQIGVSKGFISGIINGHTDLTGKVIQGLTKSYPKLNIRWIMTGDGEMLTEKTESNGVEEPRMDYVPTPPELKIEQTTEWRLKALEEQVEALWKVIHELREAQRME